MNIKTFPIQNLSRESFAPYGTILGHYRTSDGYEPVVTVESTGWIWAIKTFHNKTIDRIDSHPDTKESFEPVWGTSLLVVAPPDAPDQIEIFVLDEPVLLDEHVWHGLIALSAQVRVKITENREVTGIPHPLGFDLGAAGTRVEGASS
jgi:ureidoglycolate hydrolase